MAWWNNLNFMANPNESWSAPRYQGNFGASTMQAQPQIQPAQSVDRFSQLEFPELQNQALNTYKGYLSEAPTREQYKPGIWEKIGAALAGSSTTWASRNPAAGLDVTRQYLDDRYNRALEDWSNRGKGLAQAASIEENENTNKYRNWQARNDAILKARDQDRQNLLAESQIDVRNKDIELKDAQINEIQRKAAEGRPFTMTDANGRQLIGSIVVDDKGNRRPVIDLAVDSLAGRQQKFRETDSDRNYGLGLARFGEEKTNNAFNRGMSEKRFNQTTEQAAIDNQFRMEDLGLRSRNTRVNEDRGAAYVDYTKQGPQSKPPSPSAQGAAGRMAIEDVIRNVPEARQYFIKDNNGRWQIKDPNAYDSIITRNGKQASLSALLEFYANERLNPENK